MSDIVRVKNASARLLTAETLAGVSVPVSWESKFPDN